MKFLRINSFDKEKKWRYVEEFLSHAGDSLLSFRYYNKRGKDVLEEHLHTVLLYDKEAIIGYGHLDKCDKGSVWLGICLVSNKRGKGIGKKIMANLVEYSDNIDNKVIKLSVDKSNVSGKKLYEHFGFCVYNETEEMYFMERCKDV